MSNAKVRASFLAVSCLVLLMCSAISDAQSLRKEIGALLGYILGRNNHGHGCSPAPGWKFGFWPNKGYGWQWGAHGHGCGHNPYDDVLKTLFAKAFDLEKQELKEAVVHAKAVKVEAKAEAVAEKVAGKVALKKGVDKEELGHAQLEGLDHGYGHDFGAFGQFSQLYPIMVPDV